MRLNSSSRALLLSLSLVALAHGRQVAITIDDLPAGQAGERGCEFARLSDMTSRLLAPIAAGHIPVTAFVIGNGCPALTRDQRRWVLTQWLRAGAEIGNHTWEHPGLNRTPLAEYEEQILHADRELRSLLSLDRIRYFRSPMLQTGPDRATKEGLARFLTEHGYQQGAVTFDNSDWMFAYVYQRSLARGDNAMAERARLAYVPYLESVIAFFEQRGQEVVGRDFPQVMLLHANELNARMLPEVLAMFRRRGYTFVSLEQALADPAYRLPDEYAGPGGFSWIHRWSRTKGMVNRGEPDEPEWLRLEYERPIVPSVRSAP